MTTSPFVASDTEGGGPDRVLRVRSHHGADIAVRYHALTHYNASKALKPAPERSVEVSLKLRWRGYVDCRSNHLPGLSA